MSAMKFDSLLISSETRVKTVVNNCPNNNTVMTQILWR